MSPIKMLVTLVVMIAAAGFASAASLKCYDVRAPDAHQRRGGRVRLDCHRRV